MAEPRVTFLRGHESVNVAGESHYQEALRAIAGPGDVRHDTEAHLIPEPENEYDPNAVRVEIDGHKVGYLPRDLAPAWGPRLAELATRRRVGALRGDDRRRADGRWASSCACRTPTGDRARPARRRLRLDGARSHRARAARTRAQPSAAAGL